MVTYRQAKAFRKIIEKYGDAVTDEDVADGGAFFLRPWSGNGVEYGVGDRVQYGGKPYKCLQAHTSQAGWNPADAASLWAEILIPDPEVIPDWVQPGSTNPYMKSDKVRHNGKIWISDVDNNVWEPGVYGWTEVTA